ncbi:MAG: mycofactocin-coupled SDR family oxidoreductase [Actinomycetota bacterium]
MGALDGKVAFISGAARGQGRSHAICLAQEGADIIAVDICDQIDTVPYSLSTVDDLEATADAVASLGRKVVAQVADVREPCELERVVSEATRDLGPIDIVVANAGIAALGSNGLRPEREFRDIVDVNLIGVWNTVMATAPGMRAAGNGGSIVLVSSTQGLKATGSDGTAAATAYTASKHGVVGLMRSFAIAYAPDSIRVNSVHPTGVETPMIMNDVVAGYMADNPSVADMAANLLPVSLLAPADVSDAVLWLVSDSAKYVTGVALPVDAGFSIR